MAVASKARVVVLGAVAALWAGALAGVPPASAAACVWTGGGGDGKWSTVGNWASCQGTGTSPPVNGDTVTFPAGPANQVTTNDITGLTLDGITFSGGAYTIDGNALTLTGPLQVTGGGPHTLKVAVTLGADSTWTFGTGTQAAPGFVLGAGGSVVLGGNTLTVDGTGAARFDGLISGTGGLTKAGSGQLTLTANNTYSGTTTVNAGFLTINGTQTASAVTLNGGALGGTGSLGALTANGGAVSPGASPGILTVPSVTMNACSSLAVEINGTAAGSGYDQLVVTTGPVTLNTPALAINLGFTPAVKNTFTIINNQSAGATTGTFAGLAEGATFTVSTTTFRINYNAGDGNDVVLTVTAVAPAPSPTPSPTPPPSPTPSPTPPPGPGLVKNGSPGPDVLFCDTPGQQVNGLGATTSWGWRWGWPTASSTATGRGGRRPQSARRACRPPATTSSVGATAPSPASPGAPASTWPASIAAWTSSPRTWRAGPAPVPAGG